MRGLRARKMASLLKVALVEERKAFTEVMEARARLLAEERRRREAEERLSEILNAERKRRSEACPAFLLLLGAEAVGRASSVVREVRTHVDALRAELEKACVEYVNRKRRREAIEGRLEALAAELRRKVERAVQAEAEQSFVGARRARS